MITDPDAFRILCFGDSNTHGSLCDGTEGGRQPADLRWTGVLQTLLGSGYDVIEEGLSGRTTDLDYEDRPGCNGRDYFLPCVLSHHPVDAVVVMLGSNDLKACFDRTAPTIAGALNGYVDDLAAAVADRGAVPTIVLVSPIWIDDTASLYQEVTAESFDAAAVAASRALGAEIRRVAEARNAVFVDAADVARAGDDGLHLTVESHARFARIMADVIRGVG